MTLYIYKGCMQFYCLAGLPGFSLGFMGAMG
jgi:hypothetical protein